LCIRFPMGFSASGWLIRLSGRFLRWGRPHPPGGGRRGRAMAARAGGFGIRQRVRRPGRPAAPHGAPAEDVPRQAGNQRPDEAMSGAAPEPDGNASEVAEPVRHRRRSGPGRRSQRRIMVQVFVAFLIVGLVGFTFVEIRLKPTLKELAEAKATEVGTQAVNNALAETAALDIRYEDLMHWKTDGQGNIVAVQPNTGEINRIAAGTTSKVQEVLKQIQKVRVGLPLGQVFGSALLAGVGPWINVSVIPIGVVSTRVTDSFEVAGINQLRHRVYLELRANMKILVPLVSSNVTINTSMPIAEAIILGDVPNFYVSSTEPVRGLLQNASP